MENVSQNNWNFGIDVLNLWNNTTQKFHRMGQEIQKKPTINQYHFNDENPFISEVLEQIITKKHRKIIGTKFQDVLSEDGSGELVKQKLLVLGDQKKVDKQQFIKIFVNAISGFFDLSKGSSRLLEYIMDSITYNHDRICLLPSDVKEKIGMSRSACYRAILELLQATIIAKAQREGCYFINPTMIFKGDRITLVNQYLLEKKSEKAVIKGHSLDTDNCAKL